jgi:hypothetical protein
VGWSARFSDLGFVVRLAFSEDLPEIIDTRPFAERVTERKAELGLSYNALSKRTKALDEEGFRPQVCVRQRLRRYGSGVAAGLAESVDAPAHRMARAGYRIDR